LLEGHADGLRSVVVERGAVGAVWFVGAMGLLDEAIREHLELKRRRGGDPSAIAREEREALEPGVADVPEDEGAAGHDELREEAEIAPAARAVPAAARQPAEERRADPSAGAQETVELDMQAVMGEDPDAADRGAVPEEIPGQERLSFE
jgi:hypothetical protein